MELNQFNHRNSNVHFEAHKETSVLFVGGILNEESDVKANVRVLNQKSGEQTEYFWI